MSASVKCLEIPCPVCKVSAGSRGRIPSGRHERSAHNERQRARFRGQPAVLAAVATFDWAHQVARALDRLLEQEEGMPA